jgi:hypothetical protein
VAPNSVARQLRPVFACRAADDRYDIIDIPQTTKTAKQRLAAKLQRRSFQGAGAAKALGLFEPGS